MFSIKCTSNHIVYKTFKNAVQILETKTLPKIAKEVGRTLAGGTPGSNGASSGLIQKEMTKKNKSGRTYLTRIGIGGKILKKPRRHTSSSPNEMPAVISGNLRKKTGSRIVRSRVDIITRNVPYASKLVARNDYLKRGVKSNMPQVRSIVRRHLRIKK